MSEDSRRSVQLVRTGVQSFQITNARGGVIQIGEGQNMDFTPVELLLAAVGGCNAITVEALTKRAEPDVFEVQVNALKTKSEDGGTQMEDIEVIFTVRFGEDDIGEKMAKRIPGALERSHSTYCTVGRTIEAGTPIQVRQTGP